MNKILTAITAAALLFSSLSPAYAPKAYAEDPAEYAAEYPTEYPTEYTEEEAPVSEQPAEDAADTEEEAEALVFNISYEWLNLYIDKSLAVTKDRIMYINGDLYVPAEETALLLYLNVSYVPLSDTVTALCISHGESSAYLFGNSYYAIINHEAVDMPIACCDVDGTLYAPLLIFTSIFGVECTADASGPDRDIYLTSFKPKVDSIYSERINSLNLKSDTDYLIWVSKGDYSVRLFKKSASGWAFVKEFPCAIGAPSTPTCEGVYKFYERVTAWRYSTYYVGPVMRFNGGYALHSTLINYDGTLRNDSVGVKISHGCVRLHPADINYLYETVPLYTTVYVSAN